LQLLQKYAPGFGPFGISLNFVVAPAMLIERPMMPRLGQVAKMDQVVTVEATVWV
jgi:hypothetical protein